MDPAFRRQLYRTGRCDAERDFAEGNYINPGPWRLPHNHYAVMDYCRRLKVPIEPFIQTNYNAHVHRKDAFGGKPMRIKDIKTDYRGHISELLAKAFDQDKLDDLVTQDDKELLIESLRRFGALNNQNAYTKSPETSDYRGYERQPGGGANAEPIASNLLDPSQVIQSKLWRYLSTHEQMNHHAPMFQPVGGIDGIAIGFGREVGDLITYNAKVTWLQQDESGVTVTREDSAGGGTWTSTADYRVCTIPFSIPGQIDHNLSGDLAAIVGSMPYNGSTRVGLEFNRRLWEQDEDIYGGISYTDQAISQIVASREAVWLFLERSRFEFVPVLHPLQGRPAAQSRLRKLLVVEPYMAVQHRLQFFA